MTVIKDIDIRTEIGLSMDTVAIGPGQIFDKTNDEQRQARLLHTFGAEHDR